MEVSPRDLQEAKPDPVLTMGRLRGTKVQEERGATSGGGSSFRVRAKGKCVDMTARGEPES